jgi:hypothetical protein
LNEDQSRYEEFVACARNDMTVYQNDLKGNGTFEYVDQLLDLLTFSNKINNRLLVYLFGERLGEHLWFKFVTSHNRNLLEFFSGLTSEYRFFVLHEIKTNESLYAYC